MKFTVSDAPSSNRVIFRIKNRVFGVWCSRNSILILPIEMSNASENSTFQKCLEHFKLSQR